MKKLLGTLSILILLTICVILLPTQTQAVEIVDSGTCGADGDNLTWTLDDTGMLTISGLGHMEDFPYERYYYPNYDYRESVETPWDRKAIKKVVIEPGVTSIGDYAFFCADSLWEIIIPDTLTAIGYGAFDRCYPDVTITDASAWCKVSGIGNLMKISTRIHITDEEGNDVNKVILDASVSYIPDRAFGNSNLTEIVLPEGVTSIGASAFYGSYDLTNINIPESVTYIGPEAFNACTSLTSISISQGVTSINTATFHMCSSLTQIEIPDSVTSIGEAAFQSCEGLISISLPKSVKNIQKSAFYNCKKLKNVYYTGTEEDWNKINIAGWDNQYLVDATLHCNMKRVTFKNWDGTVWGTKMFSQGDAITSDSIPTKAADKTYTYSFSGWDQTVCTGDMEVTALYTPVYIDYTVSFCDWDGTVLQTGTYHYGDPVTLPADPARPYDDTYYYVFTGWDIPVSDTCEESKTYTAVYDQQLRKMPAKPGTPVLRNISASVVTLQPSEVYEYSMDGEVWQDSNVFSGLTANTEYTFYQRVKESDANFASQSSPALQVKTMPKTACSVKPIKPIIADYSYDMIALVPMDGYEYRINSDFWTIDPTFTGLKENTSYTVYQRIAATGEEDASNASEGVVVKTTARGTSSAVYYEKLRQYISQNATSSNGKKLEIVDSNNYTYSLTNQNEGITFAMIKGKTGSSGFDVTTHFTIYPDSKNIGVDCMLTYFSGGRAMDVAYDTISQNRSSYTSGARLTATQSGFMYITSGDLSDYATLTMEILCSFWDQKLYSKLGFGIECLGFVSYNGLGNAACDAPSGHHIGKTEVRNQREAGCVIDGYTGDRYCKTCGEKTSAGKTIAAVGKHKYSNDCDKTCNVCKQERRAMHNFVSGCDRICDSCGFRRTTGVDHSFGNDELCTYCGTNIPCDQLQGHSYGKWYVVTAPTADTTGEQRRNCQKCDHYETRTMAKLPVVKNQPANANLPAGKTAKFAVKATGTGLTYQWQYRTSSKGSWKNTTATGYKTATLSVAVTAARNGYQYRCKITDKFGSVVYSKAVTLKVVTLKVTAQPASKYLPAGKTAKFTVKVSGTGLKYQWQYRTSSKGSWKTASGTGSKTATLSVAATATRNGYQYRCKITDKYGNVIYSNAATLKIVTLKITTQPASVTLAKGKTATFKVVAKGTGLKYQWQYRISSKGAWKKATNTGNKTATLKVPVTAARNGYQYRCVITDKYGNVINSGAATLKVKK